MIHAIPVECGCFGMTSRWNFCRTPYHFVFFGFVDSFFSLFYLLPASHPHEWSNRVIDACLWSSSSSCRWLRNFPGLVHRRFRKSVDCYLFYYSSIDIVDILWMDSSFFLHLFMVFWIRKNPSTDCCCYVVFFYYF